MMIIYMHNRDAIDQVVNRLMVLACVNRDAID